MQNDIIKEDPDSYGECHSSSNDRVVAIQHEELPEPFAFVSVKEEIVSVGLCHEILYEKSSTLYLLLCHVVQIFSVKTNVCAVPLSNICVFARGVKIYLAERLHSDLVFTNMSVIRLTLMHQDIVLRDNSL
jgi:hypothetical protein